MKTTVKIAALALATMSFVACNNNNNEATDSVEDTMTAAIEEPVEDTIVEDTIVVETEVAAPAAKKTTATPAKEVEKKNSVPMQTGMQQTKPKATEVKDELKKGEGQSVEAKQMKSNTVTGKPKASEVFKKN